MLSRAGFLLLVGAAGVVASTNPAPEFTAHI